MTARAATCFTIACCLGAATTLHAQNEDGVALHVGADAGAVGGDAVVVPAIGLGVDVGHFGLQLHAPLEVRLYDFAPRVDDNAPAICRTLRCEPWLDNGSVSADAMARVVDDLHIFTEQDWFFVRAGQFATTLGSGFLVQDMTSAADWDRRSTALRVGARAPWQRFRAELWTPRALSPQKLSGVQLSLAPFANDSDDDSARFVDRLTLGAEAAVDATAPVGDAIDDAGDVKPGSASRPVGAGALELTWPLLDAPGLFQVTPRIAGGAMEGLRATRTTAPGWGYGLRAGLQLDVDAAVVAVRVDGAMRAATDRYRHTPFATLYDVDRRRYALARGSQTFASQGAAELPAPGGYGAQGGLLVRFFGVVHAGARVDVDPAPENNRGSVSFGLDLGALRCNVAGIVRAVDVGDSNASFPNAYSFADKSFLVSELSWTFLPPFTLTARWLHAPRFSPVPSRGNAGDPLASDDVTIGVAVDALFVAMQ